MKSNILILLSLSITLALSLSAHGQERFSGMWHGEIDVQGTSLPLTLDISKTGATYEATLGSPAQGATAIPSEIDINSDTIEVAVASIGARYKGVCHDDTITGTFEQNGIRFPLTFERGAFARPQTPKPPYPYTIQDVTIINNADSVALRGVLTLPLQYGMPMVKCIPAVVMVSGSGVQDRDETLAGDHKPFAVIAHHLALNGIASLRYDDRGFDNPSDAIGATTMTFASDATCALAWLRDNDERLGPIGILGHSEGGTIAFMLAGDDAFGASPDFVVSLAGMAVNGCELLVKQNADLLKATMPGASGDQYIEALDRVLKAMMSHPGEKSLDAIGVDIADLTLLTPEMISNLQTIVESRSPWFDTFICLDPTKYISNIRVPVLAINGDKDLQVNADTNLAAIRQHLPTGRHTIKNYPGLNHLLQHCSTGMPQEYPTIPETISPEVLSDISAWIKASSATIVKKHD